MPTNREGYVSIMRESLKSYSDDFLLEQFRLEHIQYEKDVKNGRYSEMKEIRRAELKRIILQRMEGINRLGGE